MTPRCSTRLEDYPRDLVEVEARFVTEEACRDYLMRLRWPNGFRCPGCVRIPLMMITDSGLMVISSERSDAGGIMVAEVIGIGQGSGSIGGLGSGSSSSRFSCFWDRGA